MSFWGTYENNPGPDYPAYDAGYVPYYNNMPHYNNDHQAQQYNVSHAYYNGEQSSYSNDHNQDYQDQGTSSRQVTSSSNSRNNEGEDVSNGAIKKKQGENKKKYWNNGRNSNERYGSGRTFNNRNKQYYNDERKNAPQHTANFMRNVNQFGGDTSAEFMENSYGNEVRETNSSFNRNTSGNNSNNNNRPRKNKQYDNRSYHYNSRSRNNYDEGTNSRKSGYNNRDNTYDNNRGYARYPKFNNRSNFEYYGDKTTRDGYNRENYNKSQWRLNNSNKKCNSNQYVQKKLDAASQRERLEQMLTRRMLECLVCCEKIKHTDKIWSCEQCYHILHLKCIIAWANSSKLETGWRCPACQNVCSEIPKQYTCYCGKTQEPRPVPGVIPHACGELCMRKGRTCEHRCTILCHPGPCPECNVMVEKSCGCGATKQTVKCSADTEITCDAICNKLLECELHYCEAQCHPGDCERCMKSFEQMCYCGKAERRVDCTAEFKGAVNYSCGEVCGKILSCGNHKCEQICHEGDCDGCTRAVDVITACPCGRTKLNMKRSSCLDPIPCCDKICGKILPCGQPAAPHSCKSPCHEGPCPPCPQTTFVRCRCGHMDKELPCSQLTSKADDARCEKKCTKKRLCGKHRCNQRCCIELEHICPLPCNHLLACGQHRCDRTCHSGRCPPCMETSFEELYCECGSSVLYPPIPCGTKPPNCNKPCSRVRPCGHEVNHTCHIGACPPCTVLCKRWCYGKHEQRSAIPCYQEDFSCGLPCGKPMPCGTHKCEKPCHLGRCPLPCKQKCTVPRPLCGHPCGSPCHKPPCRETPCKQKVPVTCPCGLQKSTRPCIELIDEYKDLEMANLSEKMSDLVKDQPVDITDIVNKPRKPSILKILECTEECRVLERNRRLAIGLQLRNPDLSQKLTPRYSDFMRGWAKKDPQFCQRVHDKLTELVQLAKQSKQKSRSHSFDSMNRDKRHFIHEYCEHFGCESAAYDQEPNRNIVATAIKDKSWLPSMSLLEVIQRENGQRKVPGPVLGKGAVVNKSESVALKLPGRLQKNSSTPPSETVDYFDNPPV